MKKLILLTTTLFLLGGTAAAQDWKEALKKAAATTADKATDGKLTALALAGTWTYAKPGVKFEGEDAASELSGSLLETMLVGQLEKIYAKAGLVAGTGTVTFNKKDNSFSATLGTRTITGTYQYEASTHVVTLLFAKGKFDLGSIPAHAYLSGQELTLVFPVTRLVEIAQALGSNVSSLSSASALLSQYKNLYVGFAFSK